MLLSAELMRQLLLLSVFAMMILAAFYLRGRRLTLAQYFSWGLLLVLLPLVGPFLVILARPGRVIHSS